ncbi:MAG TPA: hypothetical protein VHC40_03985 [Rhizomicrobium sp.]|nr:hypothetical protein [Rhizomicrobium sp.]
MPRSFLAIAALMPLMMGCAGFAQAQDLQNRSPDEVALINGTCAKVMGLRQGEAFYADCQDSLAHSLARRDTAYATAAADDSCGRQGLEPGTGAFATCMLDRESAGTGKAPALQPAGFSADAVQAGKSYYNVTPGVQWQRKRYACAQLGLTPGSGLFNECVASLEGALLPDPN